MGDQQYDGFCRNEFDDAMEAERFLRLLDLGASKYVRYDPINPRDHWLVE